MQIKDSVLEEKYRSYPANIRKKLLVLRKLVLSVAARTEGVGKLEEALKWGDPSFLTSESGSGSMVRINYTGPKTKQYAVYFLCQTSLVETFRKLYPSTFRYEGNRAILFDEDEDLPTKELSHCIELALTYRLAKQKKTKARKKTQAQRRAARQS